MATPVDDWKGRLPAAFRDFGRRLKGAGVNSTYAALAAATLWPLIKLSLGQPGPAVQRIMEVLSGLGSNVTAGKIQEWLEKHKNEADLGRAIETDATQDPDVRAALDTVLERLDAIKLASLALSPDDRIWFHDTLREELQRLGNGARFAAALNMVITGKGHHVSVIINHYADRRDGTNRGDLAKAVAKYLYRVREEYGKLELRGIERQAVPGGLLLDRVYVPLQADLEPDPELHELALRRGTPEPRAVETQELLAHGRRLVVVGGPGSGKSTVLLHIASVLADALYRDDPGPAQAGLGVQSLPLPVFVPLNGFGRFLRDYSKEADLGERTLAGFISQYLRKRQMGLDLPGDFFKVLMREGSALLLLLDGLDEVADEGERALVAQAIGDLLANDPGLRAVVSCRTAAYQGRSVLDGDFRAVRVRPLDEPRIESLVRRYYGAICSGDPEEGGRRSDGLLAQIRRWSASTEHVWAKTPSASSQVR